MVINKLPEFYFPQFPIVSVLPVEFGNLPFAFFLSNQLSSINASSYARSLMFVCLPWSSTAQAWQFNYALKYLDPYSYSSYGLVSSDVNTAAEIYYVLEGPR